jgi:hypothetical protein
MEHLLFIQNKEIHIHSLNQIVKQLFFWVSGGTQTPLPWRGRQLAQEQLRMFQMHIPSTVNPVIFTSAPAKVWFVPDQHIEYIYIYILK